MVIWISSRLWRLVVLGISSCTCLLIGVLFDMSVLADLKVLVCKEQWCDLFVAKHWYRTWML